MKKFLQTLTLSSIAFTANASIAQTADEKLELGAYNAFANAFNKVLPELSKNEDEIVKSASISLGEGAQKILVTCTSNYFFPRSGGDAVPKLSGCSVTLLNAVDPTTPQLNLFDLLKASAAK